MKRFMFLLMIIYTNGSSSQPFTQVKDINKTTGHYYIGTSATSALVDYNGSLFFSGYTAANGRELWEVDQSTGNKSLVTDIYPGMGSSAPSSLTIYNNLLYFFADDGITGTQLWQSNGTAIGTFIAKDVTRDQVYVSHTSINGIRYFSGTDSIYGTELWRSDGTQGGTYMVRDIYSGLNSSGRPNGSYPSKFTVYNGKLYFEATNYQNNRELWVTDGTAAGTILLKDIGIGMEPSFPLGSHAILNNKLYFSAASNLYYYGYELWVTDGSEAGTTLVKDFRIGNLYIRLSSFLIHNNAIVFTSSLFGNNAALWKTDGTTTGTIKLKDIESYVDFNGISDQTHFYFSSIELGRGTELWISDGTAANTRMLKDIEPGPNGSNPLDFQLLNNRVYFQCNTSLYGYSTWTTDGSANGTKVFLSFPEGTNSSKPKNLFGFDSVLYFRANDSIHGEELWKSDGTEPGTVMVKDIIPGIEGSYPKYLTRLNRDLYFNVYEKLWKTDGTDAGTIQVHPDVSVYGEMATLNGFIYFSGSGQKMWKSNGTKDGTVALMDISDDVYDSPKELTPFKGTIFYSKFSYTYGEELRKIEGDSLTVLVKGVYPQSPVRALYDLTVAGNNLYFIATHAVNGAELWKTDGTEAGTILMDILPKSYGKNPSNLVAVGDLLFFIASDPVHGTELWRTDGTSSGTYMLKDISPGLNAGQILNLTNVNGVLFFDAYDPVHGLELWKTDGTEHGTVIVQDTWEGQNGNSKNLGPMLYKPSVVNGQLITTRNNGINGEEPWVSDGTTSGTRMIQDIIKGSGGSSPNDYTIAGDRVFFTAATALSGTELWSGKVKDIFPQFRISIAGEIENNDAVLNWTTMNELALEPFQIQRSNDAVTFTTIGHSDVRGGIGINADYIFRDINIRITNLPIVYYRLKISGKSGSFSYSDTVLLIFNNTIKSWPNPVVKELNISFTLTERDNINIIIYNQQGSLVRKWNSNFEKGITNKSMNLQFLPSGFYYIKIKGKTLNQLIKLVKITN